MGCLDYGGGLFFSPKNQMVACRPLVSKEREVVVAENRHIWPGAANLLFECCLGLVILWCLE